MKPYVLMVGSHAQRVIGGIATMIQTILTSPVAEQFEIEHIASVVDGTKGQKLWAVTNALGRYLMRLVTRRVSLVYIHVGGDKSVYRKSAFILLGKLFGRRLLLHCHGGNMARYYHSRSALGRWYLRFVLRMGDRVLVVSGAMQEGLQRFLPGADVHVLPNAVNVPALSEVSPPSTAREPVRVLYLGHFLRLKGIYDLVEAIPRIKAGASDTKFLLCGLHEVKQVRDLCQRTGVMPWVEHLGPVPFEERWAVLRRADIFVLPSYEEGLPVTVLEAMAVGLPIVTTPVGGIPKVIQDGVNGFLIQPGDIEGLAACVLRLAKDPALRHQMGETNRARMAEEFGAAPFAERLADHLQGLTESSLVRVAPLKKVISPSPMDPRCE